MPPRRETCLVCACLLLQYLLQKLFLRPWASEPQTQRHTWPAAFPLPDGAGERRDLYSSSALPYAGLRGEVWGSEGTGRVFTTNMGASSGLGSLYAGRSDYASSNSGHFGEKADKGYPKGYRTARADYAASYGSSPPSRYGAGMLHPHGNRLPDDLARLLADAAAYRKHH